MEYIAKSRNVRISPRKVRLVVDGVKKLNLEKAKAFLKLTSKRAGAEILKTIESAVSNASHNFKAKAEELKIKEIYVEEGTTFKRYHYAARGRVRPYKKRSSHIRVVLTDNIKKLKVI